MSMKYDLNRNLTMRERVRRAPCDLFNEIRQNHFKFDHSDWFSTLFRLYDFRRLFFSLILSTYRIKYHPLKKRRHSSKWNIWPTKRWNSLNNSMRIYGDCTTEEYTNYNSKKKILRNPSRMELFGLCGLAIYFSFVLVVCKFARFCCSSKKSHDRISFIFTAIQCRGRTFFWVEVKKTVFKC